MENLFKVWAQISKDFEDKNIFLFLDYDGTLTPIVKKPEEAILSGRVKDALSLLSKLSNCRIAVVSGRSVENVAAMVDVNRLIYAGNHGLEIKGQGIGFHSFVSEEAKAAVRRVKDILDETCLHLPGVLLEDKGSTLSFHYRMSPEQDVAFIKAAFKEAVRLPFEEGKIRLVEGKKVFEVRPALDWDKGKAVLWLLKKGLLGNDRAVIPIYIGDDTTDRDAFRVLKGHGISVWVGKDEIPEADYFLEDTNEVLRFLELLKEFLLKKQKAE